uniref:Uncharacterized protein n=1 Tax=Yoonia rhodophyticola TaxID=3137370 RepID=A0AAN0MG02_9RHOB
MVLSDPRAPDVAKVRECRQAVHMRVVEGCGAITSEDWYYG